jgi:hypothetical protein
VVRSKWLSRAYRGLHGQGFVVVFESKTPTRVMRGRLARALLNVEDVVAVRAFDVCGYKEEGEICLQNAGHGGEHFAPVSEPEAGARWWWHNHVQPAWWRDRFGQRGWWWH